MKKLLSLLLVAALVLGLFGTIGTAFAAPVFPDIAGQAAEKDIVKLYTLGVIAGYPDGTFKPAGNITRAEFAKIVALSLNKGGSANLLKNTASQFKDVPAAQWYTGYVNVAVANGIIKGYEDGTFKPEANITEAEATTMLLRAMGFNDNLPGVWPLNYVMKAADLGIIDDSFTASGKATRAFVCESSVAMLNWSKVTYTATTNSFSDPVKNGAMLAGLSQAANAEGLVVGYSATTGLLTIAGTPNFTVKVAADVKVATGETLADLANKHIGYMTRTVNGVVEIAFIEVHTAVLSGKVASIDAVNNQLVLTNGTVVKLATGATITKNGAAATLIDVNGSDITALLLADGKAYSVVAYKLEITGTLTAKQTVVANGVTTNTFTVGGTTYTVPATATLVRNGAVVTFADLKINDDVLMSANGTTAIYADAYSMTKEAVVTSVAINAAGTSVLSVTFADGTTVANATGSTVAPGSVTVGYKTKFNLNRSGQIVAKASESVTVNSATGKVVAVGTTVTATGTTSYITLDNGVTYNMAAGATFTRNKLASAFASLKINDMAVLNLDNAGKVSTVAAYVNGLMATADKAALVAGNVATSAVITLNTVTSDIATVAAATDVFVTWDVANGKLTAVNAFNWANTDTVIGTTVTTDGAGNTTYVINTIGGNITLAAGFSVKKDAAVATFDSIKIGDKVKVATGLKYVEVTTDTTFGTSATADIALNAAATTITFDDAVKAVKVTVNGTDVTATIAANGLTATIVAPADGAVVGILATDFAGNTATLSVVVDLP